jgi:hypothetical protein
MHKQTTNRSFSADKVQKNSATPAPITQEDLREYRKLGDQISALKEEKDVLRTRLIAALKEDAQVESGVLVVILREDPKRTLTKDFIRAVLGDEEFERLLMKVTPKIQTTLTVMYVRPETDRPR